MKPVMKISENLNGSIDSRASGKRWKKALPNIAPAAKATKINKKLLPFFIFLETRKTPTKEIKPTIILLIRIGYNMI